MKYDWPGNVRELQNVVERMAVTAKGSQLNLPADWLSDSPTPVPYEPSKSQPLESAVASQAEITVESIERAHILKVLEQRRWRIEGPHGAAVVLGLKPSTLRSRMRKLHIDRFALLNRRVNRISRRFHNPSHVDSRINQTHDISRFPHHLAGIPVYRRCRVFSEP